MKKTKTLGLLCLTVLVLVGGIVLLKNVDLENGLKTNGDEVESGEKIFELEEIENISWTYNGKTLSFEKEEGEWITVDDPMFPVNQEMMEDIVDFYKNVRSDLIIENVEDLSEYGLKNVKTTITINDYECKLGSETRIGGEYYLTYDDNNVYLVDEEILEHLNHTLNSFLKKEDTPSADEFVSLDIERNEDELHLVYLEDSGKAYSDEYSYFEVEDGTYTTLDNEQAKSYMKSVGNITLGDCIDYDAVDHLEDYGLDAPDATVTFKYMEEIEEETDEEGNVITEAHEEEKTFIYDLGKKDDDYYVRLKDSDIVYASTEDLYTSVIERTAEDLLPEEVLLLDFESVAKIEVSLDGETFEFTCEKETKKDEEIITWYFEDNEIDTDELFDSLNTLTVSERSEEGYDNKGTEISFRIYRYNASYLDLSFYKYNSEYCIAELSKTEDTLTSRSDVVNLKELVNAIILKDYSVTE